MSEAFSSNGESHDLGHDRPADSYPIISAADFLRDRERYLGYTRRALAELHARYPDIYDSSGIPGITPEEEIVD